MPPGILQDFLDSICGATGAGGRGREGGGNGVASIGSGGGGSRMGNEASRVRGGGGGTSKSPSAGGDDSSSSTSPTGLFTSEELAHLTSVHDKYYRRSSSSGDDDDDDDRSSSFLVRLAAASAPPARARRDRALRHERRAVKRSDEEEVMRRLVAQGIATEEVFAAALGRNPSTSSDGGSGGGGDDVEDRRWIEAWTDAVRHVEGRILDLAPSSSSGTGEDGRGDDIGAALNMVAFGEDDGSSLESFLAGIGICLARGPSSSFTSRSAATNLVFDLCRRMSGRGKTENGDNKDEGDVAVVDAMELTTLCHRLGAASGVLDLAGRRLTSKDGGDEGGGGPLLGPEVTAGGVDAGSWRQPTCLARSLVEAAISYRGEEGGDPSSPPSPSSPSPPPPPPTGTSSLVSRNEFVRWHDSTCPCLSSVLPSFFSRLLLLPTVGRTGVGVDFSHPHLGDHGGDEERSGFFEYPSTDPRLFAMACVSPSLGGKWHRLYTSDSDGLSFNQLHTSLVGYGGPTIILVRATRSSAIFGAFASHRWKDSTDFFGNADCFLFRLDPSVKVYRYARTGRSNFMYCNSSLVKSAGKSAHGIGFGGTTKQPRLFISETFDKCVAHCRDSTFEEGELIEAASGGGDPRSSSGRYNFDVDCLEVWGVGGDDVVADALEARSKHRDVVDANLEKNRKVDKRQFLDDFNNGLIESKAFNHRNQVRGRAEKCYETDEYRK